MPQLVQNLAFGFGVLLHPLHLDIDDDDDDKDDNDDDETDNGGPVSPVFLAPGMLNFILGGVKDGALVVAALDVDDEVAEEEKDDVFEPVPMLLRTASRSSFHLRLSMIGSTFSGSTKHGCIKSIVSTLRLTEKIK
jgi:hypothetical protein